MNSLTYVFQVPASFCPCPNDVKRINASIRIRTSVRGMSDWPVIDTEMRHVLKCAVCGTEEILDPATANSTVYINA